jgi:hypothetical protein
MAGFLQKLLFPREFTADPLEFRKPNNVVTTQAIPLHQNMDVEEKKASPIAVIYQSELDYISRCILDYPNIETGGDLFGFWTNEGIPVVMYAIGPGRNANHQKAFFVQDVDYFVHIASHVNDKYKLSHMGEWHSHHQLGLARPSGHDANTIFNGIRKVPLRRMLLCIANYRNGKTSINPYMFHESDMQHYVDSSWRVLPICSPFREMIDLDLKDYLIHPATAKPCHGELRIASITEGEKNSKHTVKLSTDHWLRRQGGVDLLKEIIRIIQERWPVDSVATQWDEFGNIYLSISPYKIELKENFPYSAPVVLSNDLNSCEIIPWLFEPDDDESNDKEEILRFFDNWICLAKQTLEH